MLWLEVSYSGPQKMWFVISKCSVPELARINRFAICIVTIKKKLAKADG